MIQGNQTMLQNMTDTITQKLALSCAEVLQTTTKNQETQHQAIQKALAEAVEKLQHRLTSLEERQEDSRKPTHRVPASRGEQG
jgi:hypothetical protein